MNHGSTVAASARKLNSEDRDIWKTAIFYHFIKNNFTSNHSTTLLYHHSSFPLSDFDHITQLCKDYQWRCLEAGKAVGSEDQYIITYNFAPGPEHISRARNGLVMVTTKGYVCMVNITK